MKQPKRPYLAGQAIADHSFRPFEAGEYRVALEGQESRVFYKDGGFFVFPELHPGSYRLCLTAAGYQARQLAITLTHANQIVGLSGENEVWVMGRLRAQQDGLRLVFPPLTISRPLYEGAAVLSDGFEGRLQHTLEPGEVMTARLESRDTVADEEVEPRLFRLVRGWSIRLKYSAYRRFRNGITALAGRIGGGTVSRPNLAVTLLALDEVELVWQTAGGLELATWTNGGVTHILGTRLDLQCRCDARGAFHLYLREGLKPSSATLAVSSDDAEWLRFTMPLVTGARNYHEAQLSTPRVGA